MEPAHEDVFPHFRKHERFHVDHRSTAVAFHLQSVAQPPGSQNNGIRCFRVDLGGVDFHAGFHFDAGNFQLTDQIVLEILQVFMRTLDGMREIPQQAAQRPFLFIQGHVVAAGSPEVGCRFHSSRAAADHHDFFRFFDSAAVHTLQVRLHA